MCVCRLHDYDCLKKKTSFNTEATLLGLDF